MKRLLCLVQCIFLISALVFSCPSAIASGPPPHPLPDTKPVPMLKVGYTNSPGELVKDDHGLYKGIVFEYLSTVASYMGCGLEFSEGTPEENLQRLAAGEVDIVPEENLPASGNFQSIDLGPSIGYALLQENNPELKEKMQKAVNAVDATAPYYRFHLLEKYQPVVLPLDLTEEEKSYLQGHPVLHSLTSEGQPPYTYFREGDHEGVIADIMDIIASDLGVTITTAPLQDPEVRRHAMEIGEIDFIADMYDDYNWAAENEVWLTKPFLRLDYVAVMHRDRPLPAEPIIACARGHFYNRAYTEYYYPSSQIRYYPTLQDCLNAVNDNEADIVFMKALTVHNDIYAGGYLNLYTPGNVVFSHLVTIGISRHADPRLLSILNKEISHIDGQQIASILSRHSHSMGQSGTLFSLIYYHPLKSMALVALLCLLAVLAMAFFLFQRRRYHKRLYRMAYTDRLTGLYNLSWLTRNLPKLLDKYSDLRQAEKLFLLAVTVDRITVMKETYDVAMLTRSIHKSLKRINAENPWILETAVNSEVTCLYMLCQEPKGMDKRQAVQKLIHDGSVVHIGKVPTNFTYRIGLITIPPDGHIHPSWLFDCCLTAKLEAIATDRNLVVYDESLAAQIHQRQEMENLMNKAISSQEFEVWLQPKYDLKTRRTIGAEALVRWDSPELGFLLPDSFMGLFEKNGFAVELDYHVLEMACKIQSERLQQGLPTVPISVNQSGLHITEQGYIGRMREIIDRYRLPAGLIELEITETAFIDFTTKEQRNDAAQIIDDLQEIGFSLSMDDFCTGYSSLSMLQNLPMNIMKIDRSILLAAETSSRSFRILRHVIALGKALSMNVLVEGIETEEQEQKLLALGCDSGQGFLYARPMQVQEFYEEFLPEHK